MKILKSLSFLFFSIPLFLKSQNEVLGTWNILNVRYALNPKVSVFGEGQIRSLNFYNHFHYYEFKGGFQYQLNPNLNIGMACGSYQTFKEGGNFELPKNNNEFRLWPQIILSQQISKLKIEHRYRAEFRFTTNGFRNRFRYRLGFSYPIIQKNNLNTSIYLNNEIFFTDNEPYFERNRIAFGIQHMISKKSTILIGYLHQFDYKINDETGRDFIQIGYFLNLSNPKLN
jgi:hypothetical protein